MNPVVRHLSALLAAVLMTDSGRAAHAECPPQDAGHCVARRAPDGSVVRFPRLVWTTIASASHDRSGAGFDLRYLRGDRTWATRHSAALALGTPGKLVSGLFYQAPGSPPIVFARYAPGSNELRIDVLRIEQTPDHRVTVADAVFGPHHGDRLIATQEFLSAADRRAGHAGINPLAAWAAPGDDVFHSICFQCPGPGGTVDQHTSGVATAIGIAMREVGARLGILAVAREWLDVQQQTSGGLLWSTVTVSIRGYAQPDWWIASPIGMQLGGSSQLGTCAVAGEQPCRPEHVVMAGIQIASWAGPNLPTDQDLLYYSQNSQSGFTVLGYSLITAALVGVGSYVWGAELLPSSGIAEASATIPASGAVTFGTAGVAGAAAGVGYVTVSDALHPSSPTQIQAGFLGPTLNSGTLFPTSPASGALSDLERNAESKQIRATLANGLTGVATIYESQCDEKISRKACKSSRGGVVPRTDDRN